MPNRAPVDQRNETQTRTVLDAHRGVWIGATDHRPSEVDMGAPGTVTVRTDEAPGPRVFVQHEGNTDHWVSIDGWRVHNVLDYGARGDGHFDDTKGIQDAMLAAGAGGVVFLPQGIYLVSRQLRLTEDRQSMVGLTGSVIRRASGALMQEGLTGTGAYAMIHLVGTGTRLCGLTIDGNAAAMGWAVEPLWRTRGYIIGTDSAPGRMVYSVLVTGSDCTLCDLDVSHTYSGVPYGGGIGIRDASSLPAAAQPRSCEGVRVRTVRVRDNGGDGLSIFGNVTRLSVTDIYAERNGVVGIELEGAAPPGQRWAAENERVPSSILIRGAFSFDNAAQNLSMTDARSVIITELAASGGGNNGNVTLGHVRQTTISNFEVTEPAPWAASPHGLWIHDERNHGGPTDLRLIGGTINAYGTTSSIGHGIRVSAPVDGFHISNVDVRGGKSVRGLALSLDDGVRLQRLSTDATSAFENGNISLPLGSPSRTRSDERTQTLAAGGSPSVRDVTLASIAAGQTIADLLDGAEGQEVTLLLDRTAKIRASNSVVLAKRQDVSGENVLLVSLVRAGARWFEKSRTSR